MLHVCEDKTWPSRLLSIIIPTLNPLILTTSRPVMLLFLPRMLAFPPSDTCPPQSGGICPAERCTSPLSQQFSFLQSYSVGVYAEMCQSVYKHTRCSDVMAKNGNSVIASQEGTVSPWHNHIMEKQAGRRRMRWLLIFI